MGQTKAAVELTVLIVGAGIGGLTAAIALRRAGHHVELFDSTPGPSEIGAAINICYNADVVLRRLGVNVADAGGVRMERLRLVKASGELLQDQDFLKNSQAFLKDSHQYQSEYRLTLRAALHGQLREVATSNEGHGPPAKVSYGRSVASVDAETATISFTDGSSIAGEWHRPADKSELLEIFSEFEPKVLAMLEKADPKSLRVYPLFDMDTLPSFISPTGRLALLGDAAHPFLPHLAQGGAMAIEDGVALGVMMSQLESFDEVPERLKLYNEARYERATRIQEYTRIVGGDSVKSDENSAAKLSLNEYMQYPYPHDEQLASEAILHKYLESKQTAVY
nr:hypothetical protein B0A51_05054 [Rachicladosporium sp. CCFEE 5018]